MKSRWRLADSIAVGINRLSANLTSLAGETSRHNRKQPADVGVIRLLSVFFYIFTPHPRCALLETANAVGVSSRFM